MSVLTVTKAETLCKFMRSVDALKQDERFDDSDAAMIHRWMNRETPRAVMGRQLRAAGYEVSNTTIKEHFLRDCGCRVDA